MNKEAVFHHIMEYCTARKGETCIYMHNANESQEDILNEKKKKAQDTK